MEKRTPPAPSAPSQRDPQFYDRAIRMLNRCADEAWTMPGPEEAVACFTRATRDLLGIPGAVSRPGALKPGETQFVVSGTFFIAPARDHMILFASNFVADGEERPRIGVTESRPGHTVQTRVPAVVPDTDVDPIFRQLIAKGRVGCSVYVPMIWGDEVIGMFNTAAQARHMYDDTDLAVQRLFSGAATAAWMGKGGPALIDSEACRLGSWLEN